jgi:hypothetical protein
MRVKTELMSEVGKCISALYHEENIDIDACLLLDPNNMKIRKVYHIGDHNWRNCIHASHMLRDIRHLAIMKVGDIRTDKFGMGSGSLFSNLQFVITVLVYNDDIKRIFL